MKSRLQSILEMSYSFAAIDRDIYYPKSEKPENDAEHSFQLAFVAWHIMSADKLALDQAEVLKFCLIHDLVELHAGDVPLWGTKGHAEKEARENKATETLKEELKGASDMTDALSEYRKKETEEAKFVYGLDKLLPFLTQLNTEGRIWKAHGISMERALEKLEQHAKASTHLKKYFDESIHHMKENKERFFNI